MGLVRAVLVIFPALASAELLVDFSQDCSNETPFPLSAQSITLVSHRQPERDWIQDL